VERPETDLTSAPETEQVSGRQLRNLVGSGASQVGVEGAMRARDVSRPRPEHVARALAAPAPLARVGQTPGQSPSTTSGKGGSSPVSS
jgi:hypothetical protein